MGLDTGLDYKLRRCFRMVCCYQAQNNVISYKTFIFLFAKLKIWYFIYINFYSSININGFVINGQNKCIPNSKTNVSLGNDRQINLGPMCRRF